MTIYHDAYLFNSGEFEKVIRKLTPNLEANDYTLINSIAIDTFENVPQVQRLSDEYGAWDKEGILKMPIVPPYDQQTIAFWLMILLYGSFANVKIHEFGLGEYKNVLKQILQILGWDDKEQNLLIKGKSFEEFASERLNTDEQYWKFVHPFSVAGWAGWIPISSINHLLKMLQDDEVNLSKLVREETNKFDSETVLRAYERAKQMLVAAINSGLDLCIIISG